MTAPTSFITKLQRDADGYANGVNLVTFGSMAVGVVWHILALLGFASEVPASLAGLIKVSCVVWVIFFGITTVIDYVLFATITALTEWITTVILAYAAANTVANSPEGHSAISYLRDRLAQKLTPSNDEPAA
jgi:hypothetical protein